ncbi:hypothetical protein BDE36_4255 [Arcticibacter tournemirensis]|nr:hypothetical protein BDE36_4255 [Arcticibacter tournemirensis]
MKIRLLNQIINGKNPEILKIKRGCTMIYDTASMKELVTRNADP